MRHLYRIIRLIIISPLVPIIALYALVLYDMELLTSFVWPWDVRDYD